MKTDVHIWRIFLAWLAAIVESWIIRVQINSCFEGCLQYEDALKKHFVGHRSGNSGRNAQTY
jgi:hypothetical protein